MHCVSCEMILEKEFKKIPGFKKCKVCHKKGIAEIEYNKKVPLSKLKKIVLNFGYEFEEVKTPEKKKENLPNYLQITIIAIGLGVLFLTLGKLDVMRFLPNFGSQINVLIAFFLGVIASLSTCLALTGGIVMSFGSVVQVQEGKKNHLWSRAIPHIYFHIGLIGGFMLLGGLLGLVGSKINYSLTFTGYLTLLIAVIMLYIGLQILNIVPNITKLGFHLPKFMSRKIHDLEKNKHQLMPMIIGILTFFLPCGFTQTMQLAAVTSQSFFTGAIIMGAFAVGTLPVLLSVGIGSTYAQKDKMQFFHQVIGVVVIFFSLYSFNSGLVLAGSPITIDFWNRGQEFVSSEISNNVQVVKMDVDWSFSPTEFKVKKGVPVRWEITGINVSGCSNEIVIPQLNMRKKIEIGMNVLEFTPEKEGILPFSCWMGMLSGRFIVTDTDGSFSQKPAYENTQAAPTSSCAGSCGRSCNGVNSCSGSCQSY